MSLTLQVIYYIIKLTFDCRIPTKKDRFPALYTAPWAAYSAVKHP